MAALVASPPDGIPVDAVLVSGDVYDRAVPPVEAVSVLAEALAELTSMTTVIITGGNHDSAVRLGFGSALFADRLQVRTTADSIGTPVMVGDVAVYPLPYLDPDVARHALAGGAEPLARSHQAVMGAAMDLVRADLATRADLRSVVLAHAFVVGGQGSDSERSIEVGGVDSVSADVFDGVDYVALGHLHGPQLVRSSSPTVLRYSGSPLRYSFSEMQHSKSVTLVDVPASGEIVTSLVELPQPRAMAEIRGELAQLLTEPQFGAHTESWLRVVVTDRSRPDELHTRVRSRFPHALHVVHEPAGATDRAEAGPLARTHEIRPAELAADFVSYVSGVDADAAELALFEAAWEAAGREDGAA
jgi:exonuclease SbcD